MEKELWAMVVLYHLLPSIVRTLILIVFIWGVIKLFRIKNPAIKAFLYCIPLIKGYIGLVIGTGCLQNHLHPLFYLSFAFDRQNILSLFSTSKMDILFWAVATGIAIAFVINSARWLGIVWFYRYLSYEAEVNRDEAPEVFGLLDKLVPKFAVKYPKVILCHQKYATPIMIGIWQPKLILSPNLIAELSEKDLSIIIAHELAHLRRRDYLLHWFAFTLRDCQFFNPFAHLIYKLVEKEKEKAADLLAVKKLKIQPQDLALTLWKVNHFLNLKGTYPLPLGSTGISGTDLFKIDHSDELILFRLRFLTDNKSFPSNNLWNKLGLALFFFLIIVIDFSFVIPYAQKILVLS